MDTPWRSQMLGRLSARRGDRVVTRFASSRVAALLARLALFPARAGLSAPARAAGGL